MLKKAEMPEAVWLLKIDYVVEEAPLEGGIASLEAAELEYGSVWELDA